MIVFGSTGSIGTNALKLAKKHKIKISALACSKNISLLNEQISQFKPEFVAISDSKDKSLVKNIKTQNIFTGPKGLIELLKQSQDELFLNAIVGFAGLESTLVAKELNKTIALANKESLVVAGKFLQKAKIRPVDSEHSALSFLLNKQENIKTLYITASGGAFFKTKLQDLKKVKAKDALLHPTWKMGSKITIDSATMANKLFEVLEAYHLYNFTDIKALIEPSSIVHALVEFKDSSFSAYLSHADMQLAISRAIFTKFTHSIETLDLTKLKALKFHKISPKRYPIFSLSKALLQSPDLGLIVNAANEVGVMKFLRDEISFLDIANLIFKALDRFSYIKINNYLELFEYDKKIRAYLGEKL